MVCHNVTRGNFHFLVLHWVHHCLFWHQAGPSQRWDAFFGKSFCSPKRQAKAGEMRCDNIEKYGKAQIMRFSLSKKDNRY